MNNKLQTVTRAPWATCRCRAQLGPSRGRCTGIHVSVHPLYQLLQLLTEVDVAVTLPVQRHKQDSALHFVISVEHHGGRQHVHVKRQCA